MASTVPEDKAIKLDNLPEKPKRPASAYNLFYREEYQKLKDVGDGSLQLKDTIKQLASSWNTLSKEKKAK